MEMENFIGKSLDGFTIRELIEVYQVNDDGRKERSVGFFKDETVAKGFARTQTDANWHRTQKVTVLTNGDIGFVVGEPIKLLSDEEAALEIRNKALSKLSDEEKAILKV